MSGKVFKLCLFLALVLPLAVSCRPKAPASIKFDTDLVSKGKIPPDSLVQTYTFNFVNEGGQPLHILRVDYSCSCITAEYPTRAIRPGKGGQVVITYNGEGKPKRPFSHHATVHTDGDTAESELYIYGVLVP